MQYADWTLKKYKSHQNFSPPPNYVSKVWSIINLWIWRSSAEAEKGMDDKRDTCIFNMPV